MVSVPLTKEHVYLVRSNLLEFRLAGLLVGSSHSSDLLGLDVQKWVSFFVQSRSKVGRPDVVLPPLRSDLDTKVLLALASSVYDVSSSSDIVIPKSWAPNPGLSHPDIHVQRWLIGNIRSVEQVYGSDRQDPVLSIAQVCRNEAALPRVSDLIVAGSPASGDCGYLSVGPHGGVQATLIKETADGIAFWNFFEVWIGLVMGIIDAAIKDPTSSTWSSSFSMLSPASISPDLFGVASATETAWLDGDERSRFVYGEKSNMGFFSQVFFGCYGWLIQSGVYKTEADLNEVAPATETTLREDGVARAVTEPSYS